MHKLVIQDDEGKTTVVPLIRDEITVGRKEGNTIRLTERNVSRRHARILRKNGTISIEDLDSYNGVRVNGTRIQGRIDLNVSDRIQIGDYLIELKADSTAPNVDPYGDQKTEPIDMIEPPAAPVVPAASSSAAIPRMSELVGADAETTKMPSAFAYVGDTMDKDHVKALSEDGPSTSGSRLPKAAPAPAPGADAAEQPKQELHGRLVILSANFAGQEFELSKPALVIGRTEDNDLVINHRSISRNHAKVVRENGRYTIVDLQSSNGVRVNGEEYGKVELRRGDLIDLGHVRLRFVEPGEDFLFGRDAQAVPIPSGSNKGLWIALIGVLIIGAAAVFALWRSGQQTTQSGNPPIGEQKAPAPEQPDTAHVPGLPTQPANPQDPANPPANPENPAPTAPAADDELSKAIAAAEQHLKNKEFKAAEAEVKKALSLEPKDERANALAKQIERAGLNEGLYKKFKEAAAAKRYRQLIDAHSKIDTDSVYYSEVHEEYEKIHEEYLSELEARAKDLASAGKCTQLKSLRRQAASSPWAGDPDKGKLAAEIKLLDEIKCGTAQTSRPPPRNGNPTSNGETEEDKTKSLEKLVEEINKAAIQDAPLAARKCREAVQRYKLDSDMLRKCVVAACKSGNASVAKRIYDMLPLSFPQAEREGLQQFCGDKIR